MSVWHRKIVETDVIFRWDSSDPERAPPPLPLNPQSPSLTSRAGTSSAIQSAHAALHERAREAAATFGPPLQKRNPDSSPDRSLVKSSGGGGHGPGPHSAHSAHGGHGGHHKRMQSMQTGTVRDLSLMIEGSARRDDSRSPEKQQRPETPTPIRPKEVDSGIDVRSPSPDKENHGDPGPGPSLTPILKPTVRRPPPQPILGENTPPQSSTMLALQNLTSPPNSRGRPSEREGDAAPLGDVTNGATVTPLQYQNLDNLSTQIVSLTNIATALQKEMSQLSRRSRDNATDLLSLKEATNTRDEDIRKSLRDLITNFSDYSSKMSSKDSYPGLLLDSKPHRSTSPSSKGFHLPRIPSPKSFSDSIDRVSESTPSLMGDSSVSITLLEKIISDMSTKEGQENLLDQLSELSHRISGMDTASKLDDILRAVKAQAETVANAHVRSGHFESTGRELALQPRPSSSSGALAQRVEHLFHNEARSSSIPSTRGADLLSDEMMQIIRSVKDSVHQGGGMTAEVKALVRELRGEVLGMGREIGKKLEGMNARGIEDSEQLGKDDVSRVIDESLEQMKSQLNNVLREHRRASAASANSNKTAVDYQEIYNAMRAALRDSESSQTPDLSRDDVIEAVRDAWESYKPEIQVETLGLERDEVLACLKEGLKEYTPKEEQSSSATRDEVFHAVSEGLKHFTPPQMDTPATLSRDEIIEAVRDCLEEFEFPVAASGAGPEITREDMYHAVKEGLHDFDVPRGDALVSKSNNDEILDRLQDLMGNMKLEFKTMSEEAKQNVATNGRGTEQVLNATKDGFENLRVAIESYVDRASGAADNDEFMESLLKSFEDFKDEMAGLLSEVSKENREQLKEELEGLREIVNSSMVPAPAPAQVQTNNHELLEALHNSMSTLRQEILRPRPETSEILDALQDGLNDLRAGMDRVTNKPTDLTANDEILDALKSGLDSVREDIEQLRETSNERAIVPLNNESGVPNDMNALIPADMVKQDDIRNLEVLITQLRVKIEDMGPESHGVPELPDASADKEHLARLETMLENVQKGVEEISTREPPTSEANPSAVEKEDLARLEAMLENIQKGVEKEDLDRLQAMLESVQKGVDVISTREPPVQVMRAEPRPERPPPEERPAPGDGEVATQEDVIAIENILRNTKDRLDDLIDGEQAVRKEHVDMLETLILETRENMGNLAERMDSASRKEDVAGVEALLSKVTADLEEMKERAKKQDETEDPDKVCKTDVEAVETAVHEIKDLINGIPDVTFTAMPNKEDLSIMETKVKEDLENLQTLLKETKEQLDGYQEASSKALALKTEEVDSVGDRVSEVKSFLEEFQETMKAKLEEGSSGVEGVSKLLDGMSEKIDKNDNVGTVLQEMFDTMKKEFEDSREVVGGSNLESNEKLQLATDSLGSKIDEKIAEVIGKYEQFELSFNEKHEAGEARGVETDAAIVGIKAVAEELKLLVDTLGCTVTESMEKMEEASKTVFDKVEDMATKDEENHAEGKAEHQQTREQVQQAVALVEGLQTNVSDNNSQVLDAVKNLLELVGQHFEHSQSSSKDIQGIIETKQQEILALPPPEKYDDGETQEKLNRIIEAKYDDGPLRERLEQLALETKYDDSTLKEKMEQLILEAKYDDTQLKEKLDQLAVDTLEAKYDDTQLKERVEQIVTEAKYDDAEIKEKLDQLAIDTLESKYDDTKLKEKLDQLAIDVKYDDSSAQTKLDQLVNHTSVAEQAFTQLENLDKVHASVVKTAADISSFLSAQAAKITRDNDDREKTLQETSVALERKLAEQDHVEASIRTLKDEELRLRASVASLRTEQENLIRQKTRLTGDVSSLETAMNLRKEELYEMETRAERLERRIVEGVMDHSRVLLMNKAAKGTDSMSRKRVKKPTTDEQGGTRSSPKPAMGILAKRSLGIPNQSGQNRRIASLSQINNNVPTGGVKRSQSVRTGTGAGTEKALRKRSWGGDLDKGSGEPDKENISVSETVEEEAEDAQVAPTPIANDAAASESEEEEESSEEETDDEDDAVSEHAAEEVAA